MLTDLPILAHVAFLNIIIYKFLCHFFCMHMHFFYYFAFLSTFPLSTSILQVMALGFGGIFLENLILKKVLTVLSTFLYV